MRHYHQPQRLGITRGAIHASAWAIMSVWLILLPVSVDAAEAVSATPSNTQQRPVLTFSTFPSEGMGVLFKRILSEAYATLGYDIVVEGYPAERALAMSNQGLVDGEAGRVPVIEPQNSNLIRVPTPIYINRVVAFSRQPYLNTSEGWKALREFRLGAVIGYKFVEKMTKEMNTKYFSTYRNAFTALDNDRIDVLISEYLEALPTINDVRLKKVGAHYPPLALKPMYHYLHKDNKEIVPTIDCVLQRMQKNGRVNEILREVEKEYQNK